jgi:C_GCAxxG_C_C family probable redox protein
MSASLKSRAKKLFDSGYNCAESVFCAVSQELALKPGRAQKLATGFGAGVARQGLACGAFTGAAMAVGLAQGRTKPRDKKA